MDDSNNGAYNGDDDGYNGDDHDNDSHDCGHNGDEAGGGRAADVGGDTDTGETYLVFGSHLATDPGTVDLGDLSGGKGVRLRGIDPNDYSGVSVSSAGDVDGDGKNDILIGAYGAAPGGDSRAGEIYLVFGSYLATDPGTVDLSDLTGGKGVRLDGIDEEDYSGFSVSSAGDVDGDGKDDILIGAWNASPGGKDYAGKTYLISGHTLDLAADGIGVASPGVIDLAADLGLG